jgi:uncharacterized protein YbaA (DUF1428 family)
MSYVDFFCLPVPTSKISEYTEVAKKYATIMKDYGLLSYCEALADDVKHGEVTDFYRAVIAKSDETVAAAFYIWPDKETRDKAWELSMKDPRVSHDPATMPFDGMRMFWGGFKPLIMA